MCKCMQFALNESHFIPQNLAYLSMLSTCLWQKPSKNIDNGADGKNHTGDTKSSMALRIDYSLFMPKKARPLLRIDGFNR